LEGIIGPLGPEGPFGPDGPLPPGTFGPSGRLRLLFSVGGFKKLSTNESFFLSFGIVISLEVNVEMERGAGLEPATNGLFPATLDIQP